MVAHLLLVLRVLLVNISAPLTPITSDNWAQRFLLADQLGVWRILFVSLGLQLPLESFIPINFLHIVFAFLGAPALCTGGGLWCMFVILICLLVLGFALPTAAVFWLQRRAERLFFLNA